MLEVLIPLLIWLSGVYGEDGMNMHMHMEDGMMEDNMDASMLKSKRDSMHESPCPPYYPNVGPWAQAPIFMKPYGPPNYPKNEVSVHQMHGQVQYIHQPSYAAVVPKQTVTYIKPEPVNYKPVYNAVHHQHVQQMVKPVHVVAPVVQPKVIFQKPMPSYAPVYQKPIYEAMPKAYVKKYEVPVTQVVYQKPMIQYKQAAPMPMAYAHQQYQSKVIHVQPQIPYVKVAQPQQMAHMPVYYSGGHMMQSGKQGCD